MPVYKHTPGETILISCRELHNIITANCTINDGRAQKKKRMGDDFNLRLHPRSGPGRLSSRSYYLVILQVPDTIQPMFTIDFTIYHYLAS